jgi:3-oxoadipate enol-lactonase
MPTAAIRGATIHYRERGSGPALILLHGFPLDGRMWNAQLEGLSSKYRVIVPDQRGFGQSPPAGAFTMDSLADDVYALSRELRAERFILAGLSMGGYVSLAYVRKYTQSLRGLILLDTKAEADTPDGREGRNKMIATVREKGSAAIGDAMEPKLLAPETIKNKPAIVKALRAMTDNNPPITIEHALAAMRDRSDLASLLPSIALPTLIAVGEGDTITPPAVAESMQRAIPGAQLAVIKGAGHMTPIEQPEQVTQAMRRFLDSLTS